MQQLSFLGTYLNQSLLKENILKNLRIFKTTFKFCLSHWCPWDAWSLFWEQTHTISSPNTLFICHHSPLTMPKISNKSLWTPCIIYWWLKNDAVMMIFMIQFYGLWLAPPMPSQLGHSSHFSKSHPSICQKQKQKQWTGIQGFKQEAMVNSIWMHYIYFFKFRKDKNYITSQLFIFTTK